MRVEKVEGIPVLEAGEQYCADMDTVYYARCGYYWPEFYDAGCMIYSKIKECGYKKMLSCSTREEAEKKILAMDEDACPWCGKKHKWRAMTEIEIMEQERLVENVMNRDISKTR